MRRMIIVLAVTVLKLATTSVSGLAQSIAIEPKFEAVGHFHEGVAPAKLNNKWGFIDRVGDWVVRPRFDGVRRGADGRFGVMEGNHWGFVDTKGSVVIPIEFENVAPFSGGVAAARYRGRWGFITSVGALETPFLFHSIGRREGRIFPAKEDAKSSWRIMKATPGREPIPNVRDEHGEDENGAYLSATKVYGFSEGVSIVEREEGEALIGEFGRTVYIQNGEDYFTSIRRKSEGWAAATRSGRTWGYISDEGNFWDPGIFSSALEFSMGVAPVEYNGKWGYIDKLGNFLLSPRYTRAYPFYQGYATIRLGNKRGFLKMDNGKIREFVTPSFEDVFRFQNGLAPIKVKGLWGFLSNDEEITFDNVRNVIDIIPE